MNKLVLALALSLSTVMVAAQTPVIPDDNIRALCKYNDTEFISKMPILMELKNSGVAKKYPRIAIMRMYPGRAGVSTQGIVFDYVLDSDARTVPEAIAVIEQYCFDKVVWWTR